MGVFLRGIEDILKYWILFLLPFFQTIFDHVMLYEGLEFIYSILE